MFSLPRDILETMTDVFRLERKSEVIQNIRGFYCDNKHPNTIQLVEDVEIRPDDWLIHSHQRLHVLEAHAVRLGNTVDWMVKYETEQAFLQSQNHAPGSIHIGTVSGPSIIGNQQTATIHVGNSIEDIAKLISSLPSQDMEKLLPLLAELKKAEESGAPLKKGCLAKFSDMLKKHSDLLIALGGWAVKLLTGE